MNFSAIVLQREVKEGSAHQHVGIHSVILSFEQESRTRIDDAVIIPSLKRDELAFFMNQKYKELIKPFQEFIFHGRFLLVAHGNILSLYDTETEQWRCHHHFEESSLRR